MAKKTYKMTEELARRVQQAFGSDAVTPTNGFTDDARHETSREFINCILHADISSAVQQVDCTRLVWLPDRGDKKAWQAAIDPTLTSSFSLTVNGTTIGPFTNSTTPAQFQTALNAITTPSTPQGWVVHGNFFIYPATSVVKSGNSEIVVHEVPWIPLAGDAWATKVSSRRLTMGTLYRRGSTQAAEFIHGIGFAISDSKPFWAVNIGELAAPTLLVTGTTTKLISGMSTSGRAAALEMQSDGKFKVTNQRLSFVRMDDGDTIQDGTLIQLDYVSGALTLMFANCAPTTGLQGLTLTPAGA